MSLGEDRVRVKFNPSADGIVDKIKQKSAELIDLCEEMKQNPPAQASSEFIRLIALAQTSYEEAAMWAVKSATVER
jgi:hypothetical protein